MQVQPPDINDAALIVAASHVGASQSETMDAHGHIIVRSDAASDPRKTIPLSAAELALRYKRKQAWRRESSLAASAWTGAVTVILPQI